MDTFSVVFYDIIFLFCWQTNCINKWFCKKIYENTEECY